ncbi:MAG: hypothetical protein ACX93N_03435 [Pseudohaliea sp.]
MKHFTWLAVLASALAAAEPPAAAPDAPVVDMAVLELEPAADDAFGAPLKRIAEELDRALELQLAPKDDAPDPEADYVASLR